MGGCPSAVNATRLCSHGWGSVRAVLCRLGIAGLGEWVNRSGQWGRQAGEWWWEGGQMGRHEVGGQKWVAGEVDEWRGKEGVGITDEGAASRTRAQCPG